MANVAAFLPPVAFQLALNDIAQTDLDSHLRYLASVKAFHEELKRFFFPVIFHQRTIAEVDWAAAPTHRYRDDQQAPLPGVHSVKLAAAAAILLTTGVITLRWRLERGHV